MLALLVALPHHLEALPMPSAPPSLAPAVPGELPAAPALKPDGDPPLGSTRTWRMACAGCGRRGYRLLERHPHGLVAASARRCACGSTRFEPLAPRGRRRPAPAAGATGDGDHAPTATPAAGGELQAPGIHRAEARIAAALPAATPAPRLLACFDQGGWVALLLEDIDGVTPAQPWRPDELGRVLAALADLRTR
jgi:hypothetical protein